MGGQQCVECSKQTHERSRPVLCGEPLQPIPKATAQFDLHLVARERNEGGSRMIGWDVESGQISQSTAPVSYLSRQLIVAEPSPLPRSIVPVPDTRRVGRFSGVRQPQFASEHTEGPHIGYRVMHTNRQ